MHIYRINKPQGDFTMLGLLKKIFGTKTEEKPVEVPYKVEAPVVEASPSPVVEQATEAMVESVKSEKKPTKKAPAKKAAPKKEAAPKKPGRKPKAK